MARTALPDGKRLNILILLTDEMRYPPPYESVEVRQFRHTFMAAQHRLRAHGLELHCSRYGCSSPRSFSRP
jgi:hypothetical protein